MRRSLDSARTKKNDEFFTYYEDIEKEVSNYTDYFKDKVVYCNCDNPKYSNFWKYFKDNFEQLKIKKLVATYYEKDGIIFKYELNRGGRLDKTILKQYGDFASDECVETLKESDIVVTNPPFSLFISFINLLFETDKKFLVVGNKNAVTYKDFFNQIKKNKVWRGYTDIKTFENPDGQKQKFGNITWYTNLPVNKNEEIELKERYYDDNGKPLPNIDNIYPKYNNFDAINVDRVKDIPCDYDGVIGVPISFMDKWNPKQFEIIQFRKGNDGKDLTVNGKYPYFRILIRRVKNVI